MPDALSLTPCRPRSSSTRRPPTLPTRAAARPRRPHGRSHGPQGNPVDPRRRHHLPARPVDPRGAGGVERAGRDRLVVAGRARRRADARALPHLGAAATPDPRRRARQPVAPADRVDATRRQRGRHRRAVRWRRRHRRAGARAAASRRRSAPRDVRHPHVLVVAGRVGRRAGHHRTDHGALRCRRARRRWRRPRCSGAARWCSSPGCSCSCCAPTVPSTGSVPRSARWCRATRSASS